MQKPVQIGTKIYVDDGARGGSREKVDRFRGKLVNGFYNGTIPQILAFLGLHLKVMVAIELMGEKTLGHQWRPTEDKLVFRVKVMSQFDLLGLICPLIVTLKILLHQLYGPDVNLGWDEQIQESLHRIWVDVLTMFIQLDDIILDKGTKPEGTIGAPELIGFAYGSLDAYACAVYVRWLLKKKTASEPDRFHVRVVCVKARVTPARGTTVPRSELSSYSILTRLLKVVINAMGEKPYQAITVDSKCTISAFEKSGNVLAPYFASHVSEAATNLAELAEQTTVHPIMHAGSWWMGWGSGGTASSGKSP